MKKLLLLSIILMMFGNIFGQKLTLDMTCLLDGDASSDNFTNSTFSKDWVDEYNQTTTAASGNNLLWVYSSGTQTTIGTAQALKRRFALSPDLLLSGGYGGHEGEINAARVTLNNKALITPEVQSLGGFEQPIISKNPFLTKPYLQNATTNSITIMWESDFNTAGIVNYGTKGTYGKSVTSTVAKTNANTYIHKAVIPALKEATKYYFQVTSNGTKIPKQSFKTATSDVNASFSIGIWGDSHYPDPFSKMATYLVNNLKVDFCFTTGDLSNTGNIRTDLATVFLPKVLGIIGAKVPFYESFGNHDVGSKWGGGNLIRQYVDQPTLSNSDTSIINGSFAYRYGNSIFISIDWSSYDADLAPNGWLETFLKSPTSQQAKFRFIFIHCAPFYERWQEAELAVVKTNIPLLSKKYGITAVFSGHMHGYERGLLDGVQYITQGGGSYMDISEPVGPTIYPHIIVGTNKPNLPANFNNGVINHLLTLEITPTTATSKLHYFDGTGNYLGVIESVKMTPRTP